MPFLALVVEALWGIFVRIGAWAIRYVAPSAISMLVLRASSSYALMGVTLAFWLSSFAVVMTFVNTKTSELLSLMVTDINSYWLTAFSMLPTNILSCLSAVFVAHLMYLTFRFKIYISNVLSSQFTQGALPPGQKRLPKK